MIARPRVLVVDDERYNRELVQRTLSRYADVLVACDLDEALATCAAVAVDVLITDQRLGSGTGTELAALVRLAAPQVRIFLITGYTDDAAVIAAHAGGVVDEVIGKPFAPIVLRQRVLGP
jgi:PleD family two-component response regulator